MANMENKGSASQTKNESQVVVVRQKSAIAVILMYVFSFGALGYIGVDRFYKGDIILSFIKLFMCSIGIVVLIFFWRLCTFFVADCRRRYGQCACWYWCVFYSFSNRIFNMGVY